MSKCYSFFLLLLAVAPQLNAQVRTLSEMLDSLRHQMIEVEAGKETYGHDLTYDSEKPYSVTLRVRETKKRGTEEWRYDFNLVDLNPRVLNWDAKGDVIYFKVPTLKKQKYIEVEKDGNRENYVNELRFYANSADDARLIEKYLKACIELAKPLFRSEVEVTTLEQGEQWLEKNIRTVEIDGGTFQQQFKRILDGRPVFQHTLEQKDKKVRNLFNLADLRSASVKLEIKGREAYVTGQTEKSVRYIGVEEDGDPQNFINKIGILVANVDEGRRMSDVLSKTIGFAKEKLKAILIPIQDLKDGLQKMHSSICNLEGKNGDIRQKLTGDCQATLEREEKESENFHFHFGDLNEKDLKIAVSGKELSIRVNSIGKENLVQGYESGELENYTRSVTLMATDIENGRDLIHLLEQVIPNCREARTYRIPESGAVEDLLTWIVKNTGTINAGNKSYEQVLKMMDQNPCTLDFTQTESTDKKNTTEIFQFNLSDISTREIDYAIKGKELAISLEATGNKKYIKHYKDDKVDDYVNIFKIYLDDLDTARNMLKAWELLAEECEE